MFGNKLGKGSEMFGNKLGKGWGTRLRKKVGTKLLGKQVEEKGWEQVEKQVEEKG